MKPVELYTQQQIKEIKYNAITKALIFIAKNLKDPSELQPLWNDALEVCDEKNQQDKETNQ